MTRQPPTGAADFLAPGREHTLLASEVVDAAAIRTVRAKDTASVVIELKRHDAEPPVVRTVPLDEAVTAAGVCVRGSVPFHLRLQVGVEPATHVVLSRRARVRIFTERDPAWPADVRQTILVVTPNRPR